MENSQITDYLLNTVFKPIYDKLSTIELFFSDFFYYNITNGTNLTALTHLNDYLVKFVLENVPSNNNALLGVRIIIVHKDKKSKVDEDFISFSQPIELNAKNKNSEKMIKTPEDIMDTIDEIVGYVQLWLDFLT